MGRGIEGVLETKDCNSLISVHLCFETALDEFLRPTFTGTHQLATDDCCADCTETNEEGCGHGVLGVMWELE